MGTENTKAVDAPKGVVVPVEVLTDLTAMLGKLLGAVERVGQFLAGRPEPVTRPRAKGNFPKVRDYLMDLNGTPVTLRQIADATGVSTSALRNMIYVTKKEHFAKFDGHGASEQLWQLAEFGISPTPNALFG